MNLTELRDIIYRVVKNYFDDAEVRWGEQNFNASTDAPFVRLKTGNVKREQFPFKNNINGIPSQLIPSSVTVEVELFTHGQKVEIGNDCYYINTASSDVNGFVNYIISPFLTDMCNLKDIAIVPIGEVLDTTNVKDSDYEYRAMCNLEVRFMQHSMGVAGIKDNETYSGTDTLKEINNKYL